MGSVKTIRVKHPEGFVTINESDFNPAIHEAYVEPKAAAASDDADPPDAGGKKKADAGGKKK